MNGYTTLTDIQEDMVDRVRSDPFLGDVYCTHEDIADFEQEIQQSLALAGGDNRKPGAAIVWLGPSADDTMPNASFGPMDIHLRALVMEIPAINRAPGGTGLKALAIARRLVDLCKFYPPLNLGKFLRPGKPCITRATVDIAPIAYEVSFQSLEADTNLMVRVVTPSIVFGSGTCTLACATPLASMFFTLDESYPSQQTGQAYSAPFTCGSGTVVRAAAYLPDDSIPSFPNIATAP